LVKDCQSRVNELHVTYDTGEKEAKVIACFGDCNLLTGCDVMSKYQCGDYAPICNPGHEEECSGTVTMLWEFGEHPQVEALVSNCQDRSGAEIK